MKTIILAITVIALISIGTTYAVPDLDPEHAYKHSEIVVIGKIMSVDILSEPIISKNGKSNSNISGVAIYEIQILESFKNQDNLETISVAGYFLREPYPMSYHAFPYEVGQNALLYLQENIHGDGGTDLIIRAGDSRIIGDSPCEKGYKFLDGLCIVMEELNEDLPACDPNPKHDFGKCQKNNKEPQRSLKDVLDNCNCQASGQSCIPPELRWWNNTHFIDNLDCKFLDRTDGSQTYGLVMDEFLLIDNAKMITEQEPVCGTGTILVEGKCQPDYSVGNVKSIGDDAPFFGIFAYFDDLISWVFGK